MPEFSSPMQVWPPLPEFGARLTLKHSGISLFFYDSGPSSKPPLLLLHGLGDDADSWRHVFAALAEKYRVVAMDMPGFGRSDKPRRSYPMEFLRDTVLELMDALSLGHVALMGNSLGAMMAESVAIKRPDQVSCLYLLGGSLTTRVFSYHQALLLMALPFLGKRMYDGLRDDPKLALERQRLFFANMDTLPEADLQFLYQRVNERVWDDRQRDAFLSVLHQLVWRLPLRRSHYATCLAGLGIPTHAIWGDKDVINRLETARELVARQPNARLTVLPEVGHLPQQEAPEALLRAVL